MTKQSRGTSLDMPSTPWFGFNKNNHVRFTFDFRRNDVRYFELLLRCSLWANYDWLQENCIAVIGHYE